MNLKSPIEPKPYTRIAIGGSNVTHGNHYHWRRVKISDNFGIILLIHQLICLIKYFRTFDRSFVETPFSGGRIIFI
uniref:Uncharacterized protein n=1 Tax=Heterorhabditis bacteriophora TaxID=37862 RepID=A0A1I7WHC8_HETBA